LKYIIEVDRQTCIACGVCYSTDATHFEGNENGKSQVIGGETNGKTNGIFNDELRNDAQRAVDSCPVSAITIE
jgi:ferredoxin